jgi:hypothetical protein
MQTRHPSQLARCTSAFFACLLAMSATSNGQTYPGVKCVVDGSKQCLTRHNAEWLDGKVYFSSETAVKKFRSKLSNSATKRHPDPSLTLKANHQLVLTGQYRQVRCPVTGEKPTNSIKLQVAGINVYFNNEKARSQLLTRKTTFARASQIFDSQKFCEAFSSAKRLEKKSPTPVAGANRPISIAELKQPLKSLDAPTKQ